MSGDIFTLAWTVTTGDVILICPFYMGNLFVLLAPKAPSVINQLEQPHFKRKGDFSFY